MTDNNVRKPSNSRWIAIIFLGMIALGSIAKSFLSFLIFGIGTALLLPQIQTLISEKNGFKFSKSVNIGIAVITVVVGSTVLPNDSNKQQSQRQVQQANQPQKKQTPKISSEEQKKRRLTGLKANIDRNYKAGFNAQGRSKLAEAKKFYSMVVEANPTYKDAKSRLDKVTSQLVAQKKERNRKTQGHLKKVREQKRKEAEAKRLANMPIKVTADQLIKAYTDNELAADKKFLNKKVLVTGKITRVDKIFGQVSVSLGSSNPYEFMSVGCYFASKYEDKIANLRKGQQATFQCRINGKSMLIEAHDCSL